MTYNIERLLLEQKLEDVNMKMSIKDLRLELSAMENRLKLCTRYIHVHVRLTLESILLVILEKKLIK